MNVFNTMQAAGYEGNVVIYSALVDAYGKAGNYLEAAKMLDMMRQADCQPNLITYAAILSSCSRSDCWEEAHVLLQSLQVFLVYLATPSLSLLSVVITSHPAYTIVKGCYKYSRMDILVVDS
jgi:pentatricopeptide repeat protein